MIRKKMGKWNGMPFKKAARSLERKEKGIQGPDQWGSCFSSDNQ
jgi:hypothetical protein